MQTPVVLVTGFEPFDKWDLNPSLEIALALDGFTVSGARVVSGELPVVWAEAWPRLDALIEQHRPRWLLMLGLAGRRDHISVELCGRNVAAEKPDNSGALPPGPEILAGQSDCLNSTLPVDSIVDAIAALDLPVKRSEDAGGYLCNYCLYLALSWAGSQADPPEIGFIHVPALAGGEGEPQGLSLEQMTAATRAAIKAVIAESPAVAEP